MDLATARQRVGEVLDSVHASTPQLAVLHLHGVRSELEGEDHRIEALRDQCWDVVNQVLKENPGLHWDENQWHQGSEELRQIYEADPVPEYMRLPGPDDSARRRQEAREATRQQAADVRAHRSPSEVEQRRARSRDQHPQQER